MWTLEEKIEIGSYANKYTVAKTVRDFQHRYPGLKKQSVSDFKKITLNPPKKLKKQGRPSLLPEDIMKKTIELVRCLRLRGAPISIAVVTSVAKGIIEANDRSILVENGGYLSLNHQWGRNVLYRMEKENMKMVRRKATTEKLPVSPGFLNEAKLNFQRKIKFFQSWHEIPDDLIINYDQTPLSYVSSPNHTLEVKGTKSVPLVGKGKKKQITGTFSVTKSGLFLPMQVIYEGTTSRCHPRIEFPDGFNITHSANHWSNEEKAIEHLQEIIFPYLEKKKEELGLPDDQKALLIYDVFKGQKTDKVLKMIEDNHCVSVYVPPNLTHIFQVLDLTINGNAKQFLNKKFSDWYSGQVTKQLSDGVNICDVKIATGLTVMKPLHARWIIGLYDHLRNSSELIKNGFKQAGITSAIEGELAPDDPFLDLD